MGIRKIQGSGFKVSGVHVPRLLHAQNKGDNVPLLLLANYFIKWIHKITSPEFNMSAAFCAVSLVVK